MVILRMEPTRPNNVVSKNHYRIEAETVSAPCDILGNEEAYTSPVVGLSTTANFRACRRGNRQVASVHTEDRSCRGRRSIRLLQ